LHGAIHARRSQAPAVRAKHHVEDRAHVSAQAEKLFAGLWVPDLHFLRARVVPRPTARGQETAVRAEGHAMHPLAVAAERPLFLADLRVPDRHDAIVPAGAAAGKALAVGA